MELTETITFLRMRKKILRDHNTLKNPNNNGH